MKVLIPLAGQPGPYSPPEYAYPKPIIEINGKTMIEHVVANIESGGFECDFIFIVNQEDCTKFHVDSTLNLVTKARKTIIKVQSSTDGAACSALLAVDYLNPTEELLILNGDQLFIGGVEGIVGKLRQWDAGVAVIKSLHPRWSYVSLDSEGRVIEAAEKDPISENAVAGLYYFSSSKFFVDGAKEMIKKGESVDGKFFIAPVLNQLILAGKEVGYVPIANEDYISFYTARRIQDFERAAREA